MLTRIVDKLVLQVSIGRFDKPYHLVSSTKGAELHESLLTKDKLPHLSAMINLYSNALDHMIDTQVFYGLNDANPNPHKTRRRGALS